MEKTLILRLLSLIFGTLKCSRCTLCFHKSTYMKPFFGINMCSGGQPKSGGCLVILTVLLIAGCGKSSAPSAPISSDSGNASKAVSVAPIPSANRPAIGTNSNDTLPTLQTLNRALLGWTIQNHRHPQNFAEFASTANIQIPDPPAGKKYTLNARGFITLVDN